MLSISVLLAAVASTALAWQPDYILRISSETIATDCQPRESVVINGEAGHHGLG